MPVFIELTFYQGRQQTNKQLNAPNDYAGEKCHEGNKHVGKAKDASASWRAAKGFSEEVAFQKLPESVASESVPGVVQKNTE